MNEEDRILISLTVGLYVTICVAVGMLVTVPQLAVLGTAGFVFLGVVYIMNGVLKNRP